MLSRESLVCSAAASYRGQQCCRDGKEKSNDESRWEVAGMLQWGTPLEMLPYHSTGLKRKGGFLL